MTTAIFLFCFNLVGVGIGKTVIGRLSDAVFADAGTPSLAYAVLTVQITGIWAAWHYWQVAKTIK